MPDKSVGEPISPALAIFLEKTSSGNKRLLLISEYPYWLNTYSLCFFPKRAADILIISCLDDLKIFWVTKIIFLKEKKLSCPPKKIIGDNNNR